MQTLVKLSPEEKLFAQLVAKGFTRTEAYRQAFPAKRKLKHNTIWTNASALMRNTEVVTEVEVQKERMAKISDKAIDRLDHIIDNGKEHNALEASKYIIDQAHGKAVQRTQITGGFVHVTYDLSGGSQGEVPKEILDQLKD